VSRGSRTTVPLPRFGRVAFRADASNAIGFGHIARLYAIIEELEAAGGLAVPMFGGDRASIEAWTRDRGRDVHVRDWTTSEVMRALDEERIQTLVVDSPTVAPELLPRLVSRAIRVVMLDDLGRSGLPVGVVVNHNVHAPLLRYPMAKRALLGRRYLMLRRDIRRYTRGSCRPMTPARLRVIVTFGGSDPTGATARCVRLLPAARPLELVVIAGPGFQGDVELQAAIGVAEGKGHTIDLRRAPDDPGGLFVSADAAISSAGGTLGELAYLGCPAIGFATVADQVPSARHQAEAGLIASGAEWDSLDDAGVTGALEAFLTDDAARAEHRQRALATADGDGPRRIVEEALAR